MSWYAPDERQTRRASLRTKQSSEAHQQIQFLLDLGVTGDPREYLRKKKQVRTVSQLLDDAWETYLCKLPSAEAAGIARDILKREMGDKRLAVLVPRTSTPFATV